MQTIPAGSRWIGTQLPIQAQVRFITAEWERSANPDDLARIATVCDASGWDYVAVCDHIAIPRDMADVMSTHWMDPIATLSWLAGLTERVRLLTHVYVLPYRHPLVAAKQLTAVDHLSGGRLVAGIGTGHIEAEFELLGADYAGRGRVMDERLPALAAALETEWVDDFGASPRPVQSPRPPIWVAGSSAPAVRRAAQYGDGWLPQGPATADLVEALGRQLDRRDRGLDGFAVGHLAPPVYLGRATRDLGRYTLTGSPQVVAEQLLETLPAAVNQIQLRVDSDSVEECCEQYARVGEELLPLLRSRS